MTNRMIPTSMVSRIDSAISPLSPARTRNQTPSQQTQNPNQGGQQGGGQQRDPQRWWKRTARFDEQFCLAEFFRLPIRLTLPILRRTMHFGPCPQRR